MTFFHSLPICSLFVFENTNGDHVVMRKTSCSEAVAKGQEGAYVRVEKNTLVRRVYAK